MHLLRPASSSYICARCTRSIQPSAARSARRHASTRRSNSTLSSPTFSRPRTSRSTPNSSSIRNSRHVYSTTQTSKPFRIAIIGSGPAGFYTAYRLMTKLPNACVDMYEQLPVPYGLVRFGVAPDHPEVKNCIDKFEEVASSPRFTFIGNVSIGHSVPLTTLAPHYNAILFSYGASEDRKLNFPSTTGKPLSGIYSAREFVGWYNGLPEFRNLNPQIDGERHSVIIGQGNVALDVARILLTPVDKLRHTDIAEHALEALSKNKTKSVRIVGRRGPLQAAFTTKEARELMSIPGVHFEPVNRDFYPPDLKSLPRVQKRRGQLLLEPPSTPKAEADRTCTLNFMLSPTSISPTSQSPSQIGSITFTQTTFTDPTTRFNPRAKTHPLADPTTTSFPTNLAFLSVGYRSTPLPGLSTLSIPFDRTLGIIPNDLHGRVIAPSTGPGALAAKHVPGIYCAGWVKRGPTGVIASTMDDAFASADVIVGDWEASVPFLNSGEEKKKNGANVLPGWDAVEREVLAKGIRPVSWEDWKRIDRAERERGRGRGKEREKFASVGEMLGVLDS